MEKSLSACFIELSLEADTKKQALSLLVEKMYNKGELTEQELFLEAVLERGKTPFHLLWFSYCHSACGVKDSEKCSLWILQN